MNREEKKEMRQRYFRGTPGFVKALWYWDLFWIGWCLGLAIIQHSAFQAIMAVVFVALFAFQDRQVKVWNRRYDEAQEFELARRKVLARLNGSDE